MDIYELKSETVDFLSEELGKVYRENKCPQRETLRAKLILEEALLKYRSLFGEDVKVTYRVYRIFSQIRFSVKIKSPSFDPFTLEENPMAFMINSLMSGFEGGVPSWQYKNLENVLTFTVKRRASFGGLSAVAAAVAFSLIAGVICRLTVPGNTLSAVVKGYIDPLSNAYAGLFSVMAVLMSLFSFTMSIVHVGDMASAGAMGGKIMKRFYLITTIAIIILTLSAIPVFGFSLSGEASVSISAKSLYDLFIGFIPGNFVRPFLEFNSIHIVIIGLMFGFSLLAMGQKGETVVKLFDESNMVAMLTNNFINKFISVYVALKLFAVIATQDFDKLGKSGKMVAAIVAGEMILLIFYTANACFMSRIPLKRYIKTMAKPFLICLSSANFGAAYSTMCDTLASLGVDGDTMSMSLGLGSIVFQPAYTLVFVLSSLFMATAYGISISAGWLIIAIILSIVLVASIPNVPGAAVSVLALLYAQLGLPAEALSMMIAINAILEFLTIAVDVWCLESETVCLYYKNKKGAKI